MKNGIIILFLSMGVGVFSQSPWTQEKNKFYTQLSFNTIPNYSTIFGSPDYDVPGEISDQTIQLYGEYGFSDQTSIIVNAPLKLISFNDFSTTALGNIAVGVKQRFYQKNWILSGQFNVEANTSVYDSDSGIRTGYDAFTFTPLFLMGRSFGKSYVQSFIGADLRTNDYSSNFKIGGEIGHKITKRIWLIGFIDVVKSLENGNIVLPLENTATGLYVNDQEYGAFGFKGIVEITEKFGATVGFGGAFFGNNVPKQASLNIGIYTTF